MKLIWWLWFGSSELKYLKAFLDKDYLHDTRPGTANKSEIELG